MSGLALLVRTDRQPADPRDARLLSAAAPYRRRAGTTELPAGCAFAIALQGGEELRASSSAIAAAPDRSILLAADARIDNAQDVASSLGLVREERADAAALLLKAYERWGETFADRLIGDFAIAIWDGVRHRVVLARDAMAMRPLVYATSRGRILAASDPSQILAAGVSRHLNEAQIVSWLAGGSGRPEWSYYRHVHRVAAGSTVVLDELGVRVHWHSGPVAAPAPDPSPRDYAGELREQLLQAVASRLQAAGAAGLLLSGGLDSTAIAAVSAAARRRWPDLPALTAFSFACDDPPECDERETSDRVAAHCGLAVVTIQASDAWPLAEYPEHGPTIDAPDRFQSHVMLDRAARAACECGCPVLMTGQRGDSICGARIFDYLGRMRAAGPLAVWRDLAHHSAKEGTPRRVLIRRHVLAPLAEAAWRREWLPRTRARVRRMLRRDPFPPWLRRDAIRRFDLLDMPEAVAPAWILEGEARRRRFERAFSLREGRSAEALERAFALAGVRHVAPWADVRLAALAVQMPQYVITPAGEPKALLRETLRGLVPAAERLAARKRTPQPLYDRGLQRSAEVIRTLIRGSRAAARGYVDEKALSNAYEGFLHGERLRRAQFWRFVDVEDWLRRYHD